MINIFLKFKLNDIFYHFMDMSHMSFLLFQMVDKLDQGLVPAELGPLDYKGLYNVRAWLLLLHDRVCCVITFGICWFQAVSKALFRAHVEGQLKVTFCHYIFTYD